MRIDGIDNFSCQRQIFFFGRPDLFETLGGSAAVSRTSFSDSHAFAARCASSSLETSFIFLVREQFRAVERSAM
jgi:hypothetical protein